MTNKGRRINSQKILTTFSVKPDNSPLFFFLYYPCLLYIPSHLCSELIRIFPDDEQGFILFESSINNSFSNIAHIPLSKSSPSPLPLHRHVSNPPTLSQNQDKPSIDINFKHLKSQKAVSVGLDRTK